MEKKVVIPEVALARPKENLARSIRKVFDWENGGYGRRLLPNRPAPPQWIWGPIADVDDSQDMPDDREDKAEEEEEEPQPDYLDNALDESAGDQIIYNYYHGKLEENQTKKYLVNPHYVKPDVPTDEDRRLEDLAKKELEEIDGTELAKEVELEVAAVDLEVENCVQQGQTETGEEVRENLKDVQKIKKNTSPKDSQKQSPNKKALSGKRRVIHNTTSDLDNIIGQKLSKSRVATSSRSYARPLKKLGTDAVTDNKQNIVLENNTETENAAKAEKRDGIEDQVSVQEGGVQPKRKRKDAGEDIVVKVDPGLFFE